MARLRDIKVGMKVQIVKGKEEIGQSAYDYIGDTGIVEDIDLSDPLLEILVSDLVNQPIHHYWYPASWIKIIKDEGEVKMTKAQTKTEVKLQTYFLEDGDGDISEVFTDVSTKGICHVAECSWDWNQYETIERIKEGKMKLFKIEEVKLEVTEPSIKIVD